MKHPTLIALIAAVLLAGITAGYWLARHDAQAPPQRGGAGERQILYWHDPMKPGVKFDRPGRSPFMDMELVPVYADEQDGAAVRVNPAVAQTLGIRIAKVEKKALRPRLDAVGSVGFDERLLELVQARVGGYVTKLHVKAPLDHVRRGQPLAEVLSPDWLAAQEEYVALLEARSPRGQAIRDAARQRLIVLGVPEAAIRKLETQHKIDATTTLFAPIDGVVTELAVREGAAFEAGAPLFRINGLRSVWVNAQIPEAQVALVPAGASVNARATAWPGMTFTGRVGTLLPDVDPQTRALTVRIVMENHEHRLVPGMFVTLEFAGAAAEPQLAVPSEAVIMTGERAVVILARQDGGFDAADVVPGVEAQGMTAILSGLSEGDPVVLSGQFLIDSEASLKSAVARLSAPPPAADERATNDSGEPSP